MRGGYLELTNLHPDTGDEVYKSLSVNLCSNLIHASEENQLLEVPATADRWLPDGSFNWLAHAATHMSLDFKAARATG